MTRITNYAWNWRDQRWHECAVIREKALSTLEIEWLEGPEHSVRETLVAECVARHITEPPAEGYPHS